MLKIKMPANTKIKLVIYIDFKLISLLTKPFFIQKCRLPYQSTALNFTLLFSRAALKHSDRNRSDYLLRESSELGQNGRCRVGGRFEFNDAPGNFEAISKKTSIGSVAPERGLNQSRWLKKESLRKSG